MEVYKNKFDLYLKKFFIENPKLGIYYEIFEGGKRLRPILVLGIANFLKKDWEKSPFRDKIYNLALILELIHNTSLIIDDLPSMDNDQYRRHKLTFHYKYGSHQAYLMVYNLLIKIKKLIIDLYPDSITSESLDLEELINLETGNLILGQSWDLNQNWKPLIGSRALKIADYKTTSLFRLSILGSFFLLKSSLELEKSQLEVLEDNLLLIANNLGMVFQLSDDYLDLDQDQEYNNYGLETSPENLKKKFGEYLKLLDQSLDKINCQESFIKELINLLEKRLPLRSN